MMDAGHIKIYELTDTAEPGEMPTFEPVLKTESDFELLNIGITRAYQAKAAGEQVDLLARVWMLAPIRIGMIALVTDYEWNENEDGDQYRITNVQPTTNSNGLKVVDLTLTRLEEAYEL